MACAVQPVSRDISQYTFRVLVRPWCVVGLYMKTLRPGLTLTHVSTYPFRVALDSSEGLCVIAKARSSIMRIGADAARVPLSKYSVMI